MMREQKLRKQYLAIVDGIIEKDEFWEDALIRDSIAKKTYSAENASGKKRQARTRISVLASAQGHSLILAEIETGITHQIRAQAAIHGHPLSGDAKYGGRRREFNHGVMLSCGQLGVSRKKKHDHGERGFLLHAWKLEFKEPYAVSVPAKFEAPLPENFRKMIENLFGLDFPRSTTRRV
jgi:23S rRNA-/tRNA-specific pseudouridylate synthase